MSLERQIKITDLPLDVVIYKLLPYLNYSEAMELYFLFALNSVDRPAHKEKTNNSNDNNNAQSQKWMDFVDMQRNSRLFFRCQDKRVKKVVCNSQSKFCYSKENLLIFDLHEEYLKQINEEFDIKQIRSMAECTTIASVESPVITAIITKDGNLYISDIKSHKFRQIKENARFVELSAGSGHLLARTSDGRVFAFGMNFYGQIGNDCDFKFEEFIPVDLLGKKAVQVCAGSNFSLVRTLDGQVIGFGDNTYGQLGPKDSIIEGRYLLEVADKKIIGLAAGNRHIILITEDKQIYFCGGDSTPTLIKALERKKVREAVACEDRSIVLTENNEVYVFDVNLNGKEICKPERLNLNFLDPSDRIISISVAGKQCALLTARGIVYTLLDINDKDEQIKFRVYDTSKKIEIEKQIIDVPSDEETSDEEYLSGDYDNDGYYGEGFDYSDSAPLRRNAP